MDVMMRCLKWLMKKKKKMSSLFYFIRFVSYFFVFNLPSSFWLNYLCCRVTNFDCLLEWNAPTGFMVFFFSIYGWRRHTQHVSIKISLSERMNGEAIQADSFSEWKRHLKFIANPPLFF